MYPTFSEAATPHLKRFAEFVLFLAIVGNDFDSGLYRRRALRRWVPEAEKPKMVRYLAELAGE
jgi:hypothetical protein